MVYLLVAIILVFIVTYNRLFEPKKLVRDVQPMFKALMEDDYEFLLRLRYGNDVDVEEKFGLRIRNGLITIAVLFFLLLSKMQFVYLLFCIIAGFLMFKQPYSQLKSFYKRNLHHIDLMLPYYLKSLEILAQHYTIPVALSRSIDSAPEIFKPGLRSLVGKIESGDSSVDPYMDFAHEYPVRDSMRMMRLLYRLSLGSQDNKQEQLMMFSRTVSSLQQKAREQKYTERLEKMEQKTMVMLFTVGGGIMLVLLLSMMMMMNY